MTCNLALYCDENCLDACREDIRHGAMYAVPFRSFTYDKASGASTTIIGQTAAARRYSLCAYCRKPRAGLHVRRQEKPVYWTGARLHVLG